MKFRNWITRDFAIKFSSILLAVVVWTMVQGEITTKRVFEGVPYQLEVSPSMVVVAQDVKNLRITLVGPQDVMRDAVRNPIQVLHRLRGITNPGAVQFTLSNEDFTIPARTQVADVSPKQLNVVLDQLVEKELPVKVQFMGKPEKGFQMRNFVVNPTVVKVAGPKQKLERLSEIETQSVLLTGRTRSFVQTIALKPLLKGRRGGKLQHVDVFVKVDQELSKKTLDHVRLTVLQEPGIETTVRFAISPVKITLEGSVDVVEKIRDSDFKAYVDVTDLKPGRYQLPVTVLPAQGLSILQIDPRIVDVEVLGKLEAVS